MKQLNRETPDVPEIFLKPTSSYVTEESHIVVSIFTMFFLCPSRTINIIMKLQIPKGFSVNQEVELGVIISEKVKGVNKNDAMKVVGGYCVALDMTAACKLVRF